MREIVLGEVLRFVILGLIYCGFEVLLGRAFSDAFINALIYAAVSAGLWGTFRYRRRQGK